MLFINYFDCLSFNLLGQLLVVAYTISKSLYDRPELIPDPIADILVRFVTIGSGIRC